MANKPLFGKRHRLHAVRCAVLGTCLALAGSAGADDTGTPGLQGHPLAPRSGPRGPTLFASIAPESSGVVSENNYADPEMWGRRAREFDLGGIGCGVAIGDYDGDGRPDLFVVSKTESCRLFRNLGDWRFEDVTAAAGVGDTGAAARVWKQGATFADVNNDGHLDLYLCRFNAPNLLYLNQGDGTFREAAVEAGLGLSSASVMATFGDYDRDGWLDVFVQTNVLDATARPEGERDHLYRNNGDGTFTDVTAEAGVAPGPTHGNSALWWDHDGDGWIDLFVANDFGVPDALFRNNGDPAGPRFTDVIAQVAPCVPYSSMGSDLGDVDSDGRLDLYVTDMAATTHTKDHRTMAETRTRMRAPAPDSGEVRQFPFSALLLNTGTGRFLEAARLAGLEATDWTWSPRWEDLDGDGRVDLHVTNGMYREIHNMDLIGRRTMAGSPSAAGQVVKGSPVLAEANLAFRNLGGLRFENVSGAWGLDQLGVSFGSALGDLDGDGDLDLVHVNYQAGATLLRNDSDSGHRVVCALRGTRSNRSGIGAEVTVETATAGRQVRVVTLARGFMSGSEPVAHFGLGDDTTLRRLTVRWPSGVVQAFADIAADQRLIITEPGEAALDDVNEGAGGGADTTSHAKRVSRPLATPAAGSSVGHDATPYFVEVGDAVGLRWSAEEEEYDEFLDQRLLPMTFDRRGPALAVGTIDGGGRESVVIGGTTRQALRVLTPEGTGRWTLAPAAVADGEPPFVNDGPLLLFDADDDGHTDLLVAAGGASQPAESPDYQPRLFRGTGGGGFTAAVAGALPSLSISAGALVAADFGRDGRLDVFIGGRVAPGAYPTTPHSALLANRGGTFEDITEAVAPALRAPGMVTAALWSDVDDDGWPDLLLALDWGEVRYLRNLEGKAFEDRTNEAGFSSGGTGWWRSIAAADFNGDGRLDYAVGNLGLNTHYRASPERPALLFTGDFGGRSKNELIEAYHEGDTIYPRRCRADLGAAIPAILRRFRTHNDYARATLAEIVGEDRLAAATRYAATELRSGVFLSSADGRFHFSPWPHAAQIAPANGMVAGDFDGDGEADILVAHNSHAPAPSSGRFDGGLSQLLRGDGLGGFTVVPAGVSGLVVPGDAKALVALALDDDGWPDFLVSRNGASSLAFRHRGVAGHHSTRVVLQGRRGHAGAVGARVTADYADGTTRLAELAAGSGTFSQSSASVFFGSTAKNPLKRVHVRWPSGATTTSETFGEMIPASVSMREPD